MLLRARGVVGVLNGVDVDAWTPTDNPHTAASYGPGDLAGKAACKAALRREMGLPESDGPLFGVVSRLVPEKGLVEVVHAAAALVAEGAQMVVLGTGAGFLEDAFARLAADNPHAVAAHIGFDVPLAHRIIAGSDAFLMPSRFEPCGLNQLYSQRYGTLPVVTPVGGLGDTVLDGQTGFVTPTPELLVDTVRRVVATWRDEPERWRAMVDRGMALDLSWGPSATRYLELYRSIQG
jgi:starch synthase